MAYEGSGRFPIERASKLGHMRLIEDPHVQRLIAEFEKAEKDPSLAVGYKSGHFDLTVETPIKFVVAIDGGQAVVPNVIRTERRMGFIAVCALLIRCDDIEELKKNPVIDPRDLAARFRDAVWYMPASLPLSGMRIP